MRNPFVFLVLALVGVLAFITLLPILGVLFLIVAGVFVVGAVLFFSAPLLVRLPWFRDRIFVGQRGRSRTIRFGGDAANQGRRADGDEDVIDVEGREVPDEDGGRRG